MVSLSRHVITFMLILVISFILFTLFPSIFPHPEDFSPYAYVVAFLAGLVVWLLLKESTRKWMLIPVLLVCFFALLDETGYGSEVMDIPPIYSQSLHTEIRDLHNLIGIGVELASKALEEANWNGALFLAFLAIDLLLVVGALGFGWLYRQNKRKDNSVRQNRIVWLISSFWFIFGLFTTIFLIILPQDPKNAFIFGYSFLRVGMLVLVIVLSFTPFFALLYFRKKQKFRQTLVNQLNKSITYFVVISLLLIIGALAYQIYAPFIFLPDQQIRLERLTPLIMWALAIAWFTLLAAIAWRGGLSEPLTNKFQRFLGFLRREPAFFYLGAALLLILVAQFIDQDVIPLNTMIKTPGFHVKLWGLWTEETFEMNGAFMFIAAAFYFPKRK
jgi:hypothetical protein